MDCFGGENGLKSLTEEVLVVIKNNTLYAHKKLVNLVIYQSSVTYSV